MTLLQTRFSNITNLQVLIILVTLATIGLLFSAFSHIQASNINWWQWADGAFQNFSTEIIGAILTFGLIEVLVGGRKQKESEEQIRKSNQLQAISDLRRTETIEQKQPILDRMKAEVLLADANLWKIDLKTADLREANLQKADLRECNLYKGNLWQARLQYADLRGANLNHATFIRANLHTANLDGADLENADLRSSQLQHVSFIKANLKGANLSDADLRSADFEYADLRGVILENVVLHQTNFMNALLPDGIQVKAPTDMGRFTNEKHPHFHKTYERIQVVRKQIGIED